MKTLLTLALTTAFAGLGNAAVITQTLPYAFVPTGNVPLTFNKFDTTLGSLFSVTVSVDMTKQRGQLEVDNDSATGGAIVMTHQVTGTLSSTVSLVKTGGASSVGQSGSITVTDTLGATVGVSSGDSTTTFNATLLADYAIFQPGASTVSDTGNIDTAFINQYAFAGFQTFLITMGGAQSVNATGLSALQQAFTNSDIKGEVTVTYNYEAVPEPASALLGGLGCLALLRRRRH